MDKITIKAAVFESLEGRWNTLVEFPEWHEKDDYTLDGYVRVSEWTEVEFTSIRRQQIDEQKIALIDAEIKDARAKFQVTMNNLEQRKAELLAIPDMRE